MKYSIQCPFCGKITDIDLDEDAYARYQGGAFVQDAFPDLDVFSRELLVSSMCYACQEKTFHKPLPWHEEKWGKELGECSCCGTPVYEIDNGKCAACGEVFVSG